MKDLRAYITGFGLSIILTFISFGLVQEHFNTGYVFRAKEALVPILVILALMQFFVQIIFFFHLSEESKPRWNFIVFAFALLIVAILVGGTLWIMQNLTH